MSFGIELIGPELRKALQMPENDAAWEEIMKPGFNGSVMMDENHIITIVYKKERFALVNGNGNGVLTPGLGEMVQKQC